MFGNQGMQEGEAKWILCRVGKVVLTESKVEMTVERLRNLRLALANVLAAIERGVLYDEKAELVDLKDPNTSSYDKFSAIELMLYEHSEGLIQLADAPTQRISFADSPLPDAVKWD